MVTHEKLYELLINCICIPQPQLSLLLFFLKINTSLQLLLNFIQSTSLFVDLDNSYYHQPINLCIVAITWIQLELPPLLR
mmetsp:Transcript_742/g.1183  ORF Transcript_742/g.1183 Transcript_742/m.1183 type:complete len:80 (-) Transcript_742:203-442(-)